ncbi:MAG: AMP-binding protein [Gracilimonas sp.]|uniref:AMP-binding protein n=1 Tax=Gracilimonas TaxID=649462 RepID=UPI001AFCF81B|nr:AMP-binding protein [Gracilimonas sp.]MBO6587319.1 AMP-binding protein [Gracilimonas sp.]MBO6614193.1 AMP-binding protein [Gracilimonas sp.]
MKFKTTDVSKPAGEILSEVMGSSHSQLLIPPKLADENPPAQHPESDEKYIGLFSSGTTGSPKEIWNSYENLARNARFTAEVFGVKSTHRLLMMAAPWHVAGLSWGIMAEELGCEYQFITTKKGEGDKWLKNVREFKPDFLLTVPAVLRALYDEEWFVPQVVFGGYSLDEGEFQKLNPHCDFTIQGYGQTEAGGLIAAHKRKSTAPVQPFGHLCSGHPIRGVRLKCEGTPENPAPIYIQSETAFIEQEYNSRDVGFMDSLGRVYVLGRAGEIVNKK